MGIVLRFIKSTEEQKENVVDHILQRSVQRARIYCKPMTEMLKYSVKYVM
jgi:hypothetical protein